MKKLLKLLDKTFWLYVVLGFLNYGICNAIMLWLHHSFDVATDPALYIEFALQTMVSFVLNRWVTFRGRRLSPWWPALFFLSVGASYLLAKVLLFKVFEYLITLPFFVAIADWLQGLVARSAEPAVFRHDLVMLACTFVYCVINYVGQRYFVFRPRKENV